MYHQHHRHHNSMTRGQKFNVVFDQKGRPHKIPQKKHSNLAFVIASIVLLLLRITLTLLRIAVKILGLSWAFLLVIILFTIEVIKELRQQAIP